MGGNVCICMHLLHHETICGLWALYYNKLFASKILFNGILHISVLLCHVQASATCVKFEASIWSLNYLHYVYKCVMHVILSYVFIVDPCFRTEDRHDWFKPMFGQLEYMRIVFSKQSFPVQMSPASAPQFMSGNDVVRTTQTTS